MSETSSRMRAEWSVNDAKRDAGLKTPDSVKRWDDIQYGPYGADNRLDVYRPKAAEGKKLPVIISIHGGGWVYGDKELYQFYCMSLSERGFAVVNFTYRLAPENKFPAQLEDTNLAVKWTLDHAEEYGFDAKNVFMVGDSAGAHLLGLYTAFCTDKDYAANYSFHAPEGFVPRALGMNCGAYEPISDTPHEGTDMNHELMEDLLPEKGTAKEAELINVNLHVNKHFPPVFLMTCYGDFCMDHAPGLEERLKSCGVPYVYKIYGSPAKPLYHVFHLTVQGADGQGCNDEECAFFRSVLDGKFDNNIKKR